MFIKWLDKKLNKFLYKLHGIDKRGNIPYSRNEMIISGGGNRVIVIDNGKEIIINQLNFKKYLKGVQLLIRGNNNTVIFHLPTKFIDTKLICIGDYNEMVFQKTKHKYDRSILRCFNGSKINIGEDFSVASNLNVCMSKGNLSIGEDCMFSDSIEIFNNDGHKILNKNGELINKPKDIIIKNHVWVGKNVTIIKNAYIPNNAIVGTRCLCNNRIENDNGVIVAGIPARIVKENVSWVREAP